MAVNKLTWPQVGRVTEPGRYMFTFGWLTITAEDLAIWEKYPDAAFTLFSTSDGNGRWRRNGREAGDETVEEFRLGTFELRENFSLSEK